MIKTQLDVPAHKLSAGYTVEEAEFESFFGEELRRAIDAEVANEIASQMLSEQGWHKVTVESWDRITDDWVITNIQGQYRCFGHYWYFEQAKDAALFLLRWS